MLSEAITAAMFWALNHFTPLWFESIIMLHCTPMNQTNFELIGQ